VMSRPLLVLRPMVPLSRLWPKRKATVENSVAMDGSTLGFYPVCAGRAFGPRIAGRNSVWVMISPSAMFILRAS
jgi:hypothetical protein